MAQLRKIYGWIAGAVGRTTLCILMQSAVTTMTLAKPAAPALAVEEGAWDGRSDWPYVALSPDLTRTRLVVATAPGGGLLERMVPRDFLAAINGGYFDRRYAPTGWLVSEGRELHRVNTVAKGGVLAIAGDQVYIGARRGLPFGKADLIVQNGPTLIDANGRIAIRSGDGRRAARTVACLAGTRLHIVVIRTKPAEGPTLMETAEVLARPRAKGGFGCERALNLDGGSSTGVVFATDSATASRPPIVPIGYGLAFVPRAPR